MSVDFVEEIEPKPFLRYVGGKRWFVKNEILRLPIVVNNYYEPFLGSGAIFFALKKLKVINGTSYLSDINKNLIESYVHIKNDLEKLIQLLSQYRNTKEDFYRVRSTIPSSSLERAARFIYLNRTSFGGIYRENKDGKYNVPYGNRSYKELFDFNNLDLVKELLLEKTDIRPTCFSAINLNNIQRNDFFCFDPPYLGKEDKFNRYHSIKFGRNQSELLLQKIERISERSNFLVFVGNDKSFADKLSNYGEVSTLNRPNNLSNNRFQNKQEIIIKNY